MRAACDGGALGEGRRPHGALAFFCLFAYLLFTFRTAGLVGSPVTRGLEGRAGRVGTPPHRAMGARAGAAISVVGLAGRGGTERRVRRAGETKKKLTLSSARGPLSLSAGRKKTCRGTHAVRLITHQPTRVLPGVIPALTEKGGCETQRGLSAATGGKYFFFDPARIYWRARIPSRNS